MAVTWKKLAYEDDVVLESLFDANSIVAANADNTPLALPVGASTLVGRGSSGNIDALTAAEVRALLNVDDGADVTGANAPQAHAAIHKDAGGDEIKLNELGEPTAAVKINGQQMEDPIFHQVADASALAALTPVVGKFAMQVDTLAPYVCTSSE